MGRVVGALLAAMLPGLVLGAPAHELSALDLSSLMEREVVSASRYREPQHLAPAAVTVISREDIRRHAWRSLADALDSIPGLFISNDRGYRYLGVRGFLRPADYNTLVALLVDGLPVNDPLYSQAYLGGAFLLDLEVVERIEFVPGPGSSLHGSNALLGVINVVTRSGRAEQGLHLGIAAGNTEKHRQSLRLGIADARQDLLLATSAAHDHGETVHMPGSGSVSEHDGERVRRSLLKYARGNYRFSLAYVDRLKYYPTAAYGTLPGSDDARHGDRQLLAAVEQRSELEAGLFLDSRAHYSEHEFIGHYPYADGSGTWINVDEGRSRSFGIEVQSTDTRHAAHTLVLGTTLRRDTRLRQRNYDLQPRADYLDQRDQQTQLGLYAQDSWNSGPLQLNSGLRFDHYSSFGNTLNPRLALVQQLDPATTLKYLFGTAYRAPNAFEMYYTDGGELMKANPALRPERMRSLELALQHRASPWALDASLFQNRIGKLISQRLDPADGLLHYVNGSDARISGSQLALQGTLPGGASAALSWGWQYAQDLGPRGGALPFMPRYTAKADLGLPLGHWQLTLEARHVSRRSTRDGSVGGSTLFNLAVAGPPARGLLPALALRVDNLFDRAVAVPASDEYAADRIPQEGLRASLTATWSL